MFNHNWLNKADITITHPNLKLPFTIKAFRIKNMIATMLHKLLVNIHIQMKRIETKDFMRVMKAHVTVHHLGLLSRLLTS